MLFTKIFYEDREIDKERIELTDKGALYFIGPNLTLRNCTLVLKVPARNLIFDGVRFIDCTFEVKQELKNHDWSRAFLKGCRFTGRLSGCDFGHRLPHIPGREHGGIEECDFSEARLDGCRVHGCDTRTLKFPPWPCFTILDPLGRVPELRSVKWPGVYGNIIPDTLLKHPSSTKAITYYSPALVKLLETTPKELSTAIGKFDFIIC